MHLIFLISSDKQDYIDLDDCYGIFYIYGSPYFKNYLGSFIYSCYSTNEDIVSYIANSSTISLFYAGTALPYGYVQQVYRVVDEHTANCIVQDNLIYASPHVNHSIQVDNIKASSMGHCLYTIVVPVFETGNMILPALEFSSMNYNGSSHVKVVTGYNDTYTLLEYGENDAKFWNNVIVSGNLKGRKVMAGYRQNNF